MVLMEEGSVSPQDEPGWSGCLVPRAQDYDWHKLIQIYDFIQLYFANEAEGVRLVIYNLNFWVTEEPRKLKCELNMFEKK